MWCCRVVRRARKALRVRLAWPCVQRLQIQCAVREKRWLVLCTWWWCSQRKDLFVVVDLGGACGRIRVYFFNVVCTAGMLC